MLTALLDKDYSDVAGILENLFIMAMYWSLGATLLEEGRERFDHYIRRAANFVEAPEGKLPVIG